jgi:hypothetical protein
MLLSCLFLLLLTPLALSLSPQKATSVPTTALALSLSLLRRSLAQSVFSDVPADLSHSPLRAARALKIAHNSSPQKAGAAAGQPAVCVTAKGARADVDRAVLRAVAAAAMPPPISSSAALAS